MDDDELAKKLDALITVTKLANWGAIAETRTHVRADLINGAILDASTDWIRSGTMQKAVAKQTKSGTRTVRDRIGSLVTMGALETRGGGPTTEYKACGLI